MLIVYLILMVAIFLLILQMGTSKFVVKHVFILNLRALRNDMFDLQPPQGSALRELMSRVEAYIVLLEKGNARKFPLRVYFPHVWEYALGDEMYRRYELRFYDYAVVSSLMSGYFGFLLAPLAMLRAVFSANADALITARVMRRVEFFKARDASLSII